MNFYGLLDLPWWGYVLTTLVLTHISIAAVTIFFHRSQAHRAVHLHPAVSHFFRFWLWMTTGMVTKAWVAIHRKHHAKCETIDDPHSPQILGLATVLWQGSELYRRGAKDKEILARYGDGTPDDWMERHVYTPHSAAGILSMMAIDILLMGVPGLMVWAVQMAWMPFWAAGIVNGVGHFWGYRNFDCPDAATNVSPWGILIGGEELHNNHHAYPSSAKLSIKPWEFDIGWLYIRTLQRFGLAQPRRVPPTSASVSGKKDIEVETMKALLTNRFEVMARYTKVVLMPVLKSEIMISKRKGADQAAKLLGSMKKLMKRELLIDALNQQHLDSALARHQALQQVYQFRARLQNIWNHTSATQKELQEALQTWCQEAEKTGVKALHEFSDYIKGYSIRYLL